MMAHRTLHATYKSTVRVAADDAYAEENARERARGDYDPMEIPHYQLARKPTSLYLFDTPNYRKWGADLAWLSNPATRHTRRSDDLILEYMLTPEEERSGLLRGNPEDSRFRLASLAP